MGSGTRPGSESGADASSIASLLARWVDLVGRHAYATLGLTLATTLALGGLATTSLGFNVDPNALFSADLRFQKMIREFQRYFPVLTDSLLIVIDAETPERARDAQERLAAALAERDDVYKRVFLPGEEPFFERHALLYLDIEEVETFSDEMARLQPVLAELSANPSLRTLADVVDIAAEELDLTGEDADRWASVLDPMSRATETLFDPDPTPLSWENVLLEGSGIETPGLRVIVADPILELERVLAAERGIETVREIARELGLDREAGTRVRITGYPALNHEEMLGLATDTAVAGILSFVLVVLVMVWAFRSLLMVVAAAITLVVGVIWSAAFAGATVSVLNPLSITFGVLVIGLGIDFVIHFGMQFTAAVRRGHDVSSALQVAVAETGVALVLCGVTTTVGFLAFVPTDYRGVSDLGLLASGGILVLLFQTLTLLPALLRVFVTESAHARLARSSAGRPLPLPRFGRPAIVAGGFAALGIGCVPLLPRVDLDTNVIRMRNPHTESVQAFEDLLASREATPWYLDALTPSLDAADQLAEKLRDRPGIDRVLTLSDFLPADQDEKLELLDDTSMFLNLGAIADFEPTPPTDAIDALESLARSLAQLAADAPADSPLRPSARRLERAIEELLASPNRSDAKLHQLQETLLGSLPDQLRRLNESLEIDPLAIDALPPDFVDRLRADNGMARVQVYPSEDLWANQAMIDFVEGIRPLWSEITGLPVNLVESAEATWDSLRQALLWATGAILVLLMLLWRRVDDTLVALGPLVVAVVLTQVSTLVLPVDFTFANVMVLPLLLGIGIDGAIHLVHRARRKGRGSDLTHATTARAVWFSALSTIASFGTLVISNHHGVASLGYLLVIGMGWVLVANLVVLPALLAWRGASESLATAAS